MRFDSVGSVRQSPLFAGAVAAVLALCAGVAATGMTQQGQVDSASALALVAAPHSEGTVPPHTIGLTADYFAALGISEAGDRSPAAEAKVVAPSMTSPPERLARRQPAADSSDPPLAKARVCGDSVSVAAAKSPPTTES